MQRTDYSLEYVDSHHYNKMPKFDFTVNSERRVDLNNEAVAKRNETLMADARRQFIQPSNLR